MIHVKKRNAVNEINLIKGLRSTIEQRLLGPDSRRRSIGSTSINEHTPILTCLQQRWLGGVNRTSTVRLECIEDMTKHLTVNIRSP
jgi:hypothetical protein